jgi:secondary thiamine-phosphate synthase enzyme
MDGEMDNSTLLDIQQTQCILKPRARGFHLITQEVQTALLDIPPFELGLVHLFLQHTSASIAISENACKDVAIDLENYFSRTVPDDNSLYHHTLEGEDDMPAHIKNVMLGASLMIPLRNHQMLLGEWINRYFFSL